MKDVEPVRLGQIEADAPFVAVARQIVGAQRVMKRRAPRASFVAVAGTLHFDNVRPEIAKQLTAKGPGQDTRSVQNANTGQRSLGIGDHANLSFATRLDHVQEVL